MDYFSSNIRAIREHWGLSQEDMGNLLLSNRGVIMQAEKRGSRPRYRAFYLELQKLTGISRDKIGTEEVNLETIPKLPIETIEHLQHLKQISGRLEKRDAAPIQAGVPVYALEATAGNIEQVAQDIPEKIEGYISLASFRDCIAFLYVKGESMYPTFKSGDLVGVCPVDHEIIQYGNPYLIVTTDNQRMIKFIRAGVDEEHVILRSKNKEFDDIPMRKEKIIKLYKVKGPIRDDWQ